MNLAADAGSVILGGRIDTSGIEGGDVSLFGVGGVQLSATAVIDTRASGYGDSRQARAGDVTLGVDGTGVITLASGSLIDVSAKRPGDRLIALDRNGAPDYLLASGDLGGQVHFRAPLIERPGPDTVGLSVSGLVRGSREVVVEGFKRFNLADVPGQGFVGVSVAGGVATLDPGATGGVNFLRSETAGTIPNFIQTFNLAPVSGLVGAHLRPGVELDYRGDITLAANWNLAAAVVDETAAVAAGDMHSVTGLTGRVAVTVGRESDLLSRLTNGGSGSLGRMLYRVGGDVRNEAGALTLRASGNLNLNGSLTDGFFQFRDQRDTDYVNHALGGGDRTQSAVLLPSCTTDDCAGIIDYRSHVAPTDFIDIVYPIFAGVSAGGQAVDPFVEAPYSSAANSASPTGLDPLGSAELFPRLTGGRAAQSWSYQLAAGADLGTVRPSVDPSRVAPTLTGSVLFSGAVSYSVKPVRGTVTFANRFVVTTDGFGDEGSGAAGKDTVAADQWLAQFRALHPDVQAGDFTILDFSSAPVKAQAVLAARAKAYFLPLASSQYEFVGSPASPLAVYTSLAQAAGFLAGSGGDFTGIRQFYPSPKAPLLEASLTGLVKPEVRTGAGSISVAAARDIDLRGSAAAIYSTAAGAKTTESLGFQVGGSAVYSAGVVADLSARTAVDAATGARMTLDPSTLVSPGNAFLNFAPAPSAFPRSIVANPVYATGGGDLTLSAGRDVLSRRDVWQESQAAVADWSGTADQQWRMGAVGQLTDARINPQLFTEGLGALAGGNVRVAAGRDVSDLSVISTSALATAGVAGNSQGRALVTLGGGSVSVTAGANVLGGRIDVASGRALISAGDDIADSGALRFGPGTTPVENALRLRLTDATVELDAGGSANLRGIGALGLRQSEAALQNNANSALFYSPTAGVSILANGAVAIDNKPEGGDLLGPSGVSAAAFYPGSLSIAALGGNIVFGGDGSPPVFLAPTTRGTVSLLSGGDIDAFTLIMDDSDPAFLPGLFTDFRVDVSGNVLAGRAPRFPAVLPDTPDVIRRSLHNRDLPHLGDLVPNRVYADGSINGATISSPKLTRIGAGQDIIDMMFFGQNLNAEDITRITADRDIIATTKSVSALENVTSTGQQIFGDPRPTLQGNTFVIGGQGSLFLEAGRDAGPFLNSAVTSGFKRGGNSSTVATGSLSFGGGILSVGSDWNPWLPDQGATLVTEFGVGKGQAFDAFRDAYLDPAKLSHLDAGLFEQVVDANGVSTPNRDKPIYGPILIDWMKTHAVSQLIASFGRTDVTYQQAFDAFKRLPALQQRLFIVSKVYFNELVQPANPSSIDYLRYARSYKAIDTLFPSTLGYTKNDLTGASNGAETTIDTGNLDLRLSTIQTVRGGDIFLLGPGGQVLAGSTVRTTEQAARRNYGGARLFGADPGAFVSQIDNIPAGFEGVLTLRGGAINTFTDRDFRLNQSRLFTEAGGNIAMWSSNGDLNAGQGPRSSANFPPVVVRVDENANSRIDLGAATTGAGIGAFQPAVDKPAPDVFLLAPRGTVDAGDAGVRVTGNLFIAALSVANSDNFKVSGSSIGVTAAAPIDVGGQTGANAAAAAAQQAAQDVARSQSQQVSPSVISVDVVGFVEADESDNDDNKKKIR